ncbi:mechanosensitive ion channel family protein [Gracilibacillus alcaliphilus]|uniref:mechanosensitive ion channel family protein n=1 Tax=Gracilibacillus alcaliphilus TaxID=1401441 RepID=UPI00195E2555|nr:mechanosensitive ion channel domain-containing protein [Gracilibacillus alcaliphilus]MBM7676543.1 small conductance mechanosensitive channel [Gracilibacillus alcaliphilus]
MDWIELALPIAKSIALALIILIVGLFIIRILTSLLDKQLEKTKIDKSLKPFLISLCNGVLKILLILSVISILGVPTSSFVAIIAASGFAIGLAFQGSLANFAGGVLLLTLRPFNVGDYIEGGGYEGTVRAIQILYTELITPDNKVIFIPNGSLSNAGIVNFSANDNRRVDFTFQVSSEVEVHEAITKLQQMAAEHPGVMKNPAPFVRLSGHEEGANEYTVQVWVQNADYNSVYYDLLEQETELFA